MDFLRWLESIRIPGLNEFMLAVTYLGDEIAFLVVALILFWCVDKRRGYYVLAVGFLGTITSQFMKIWCRVPRPWYQDENFTILEQAREGASGYSFPSGHTQSALGVFGSIARVQRQVWLRSACIIACILVPISRMYLGVHTPADVGVSILVALILIFVLYPVVEYVTGSSKRMRAYLMIITLLAGIYLAFVLLYPFPADIPEGSSE